MDFRSETFYSFRPASSRLTTIFIIPPMRLCLCTVCLFVCLFVCVSVSRTTQKVIMDFYLSHCYSMALDIMTDYKTTIYIPSFCLSVRLSSLLRSQLLFDFDEIEAEVRGLKSRPNNAVVRESKSDYSFPCFVPIFHPCNPFSM